MLLRCFFGRSNGGEVLAKAPRILRQEIYDSPMIRRAHHVRKTPVLPTTMTILRSNIACASRGMSALTLADEIVALEEAGNTNDGWCL